MILFCSLYKTNFFNIDWISSWLWFLSIYWLEMKYDIIFQFNKIFALQFSEFLSYDYVWWSSFKTNYLKKFFHYYTQLIFLFQLIQVTNIHYPKLSFSICGDVTRIKEPRSFYFQTIWSDLYSQKLRQH